MNSAGSISQAPGNDAQKHGGRMSASAQYSQMDWNTAEIRAFKNAFLKRRQATGLDTLFVDSATTAFAKASAMVAKRREHALKTLAQVEKQGEGGNWPILGDLRSTADSLSGESDQLETHQPSNNKRDEATQALDEMSDRWIEFEATCISVRNEMTTSKTADKFDEKLLERENQLSKFASDLTDMANGVATLAGDFNSRLNTTIKNLSDARLGLEDLKSGVATEVSVLDVDRVLVKSKEDLKALASELAKADGQGDEVLKAALGGLYGLTIDVEAPKAAVGNAPQIPYQALLDAFSMVPADHIVADFLKGIDFKTLDKNVGGLYSKDDRRIKLPVTINLRATAEFINPETGKKDSVNSFSKTTLHEIGHSVDHAYGIMATNCKEKGCGGWTEVDPFTYVQGEFETFQKAVALALRGRGDTVKTAVEQSKPDFVRYMAGENSADDLAVAVRNAWTNMELPKLNDKRRLLDGGADKLADRIRNFFAAGPSPRRPGASDRLGPLSVGCKDAIEALTTAEPPVFTARELSDRVAKVSDTGEALAKWVEDTCATYLGAMFRDARVEWDSDQELVKRSLPKQGELAQYLATASPSPWTIDTSRRTIGKLPASHQSKDTDDLWWRYDGGARQSTYVTDYQWRAPGEWFAELYAFTWLNEIEPPAGVARSVRPYLYGGHVTPSR
jgi:hypothetical protein